MKGLFKLALFAFSTCFIVACGDNWKEKSCIEEISKTAKYDFEIQEIKASSSTVEGVVTLQNGFGAKTTKKFMCSIDGKKSNHETRLTIFDKSTDIFCTECQKQESEIKTVVPIASEPRPTPVAFVESKYIRPYKYNRHGVTRIAEMLGVKTNKAGNIDTITDTHRIIFKAVDGVVNYSEIHLLETVPCNKADMFDPQVMLDSVAENIDKLVLNKELSNGYVFLQHNNKVKITVTCDEDGEPIKVKYFKDYGY